MRISLQECDSRDVIANNSSGSRRVARRVGGEVIRIAFRFAFECNLR